MQISRRITDLKQTVKRLVDLVNGKIDFVDNISCKIVDVADTGLANTTFTVNHDLGRIPKCYIWNIDRAGTIYDFSRATWTETQITLRCSVANAVATLVIF